MEYLSFFILLLVLQMSIFIFYSVEGFVDIRTIMPIVFGISIWLVYMRMDTLLSNIKHSGLFLILGLLFFLLRDIAGYGTFTFFGKNHMLYEKILLNTESIGIFSFIASIPGALILSGLLLFVYMLISKKFKILKNMEQQQ